MVFHTCWRFYKLLIRFTLASFLSDVLFMIRFNYWWGSVWSSYINCVFIETSEALCVRFLRLFLWYFSGFLEEHQTAVSLRLGMQAPSLPLPEDKDWNGSDSGDKQQILRTSHHVTSSILCRRRTAGFVIKTTETRPLPSFCLSIMSCRDGWGFLLELSWFEQTPTHHITSHWPPEGRWRRRRGNLCPRWPLR